MNPSSAPVSTATSPHRWDIFCRVVDNFGDVGVCWRLAADLARRGVQVRLVCDDSSALTWMAPQGHAHVHVAPWPDGAHTPAPHEVADVVIEAFGCDPPGGYVRAMQALHRLENAVRQDPAPRPPPVWINLEYLSAEDYVERSHGLPSPQPGGLLKWFFFPGFTPRTGGLLREADLPARRAAFKREQWLAAQGISLRPGERLASLFCYESDRLPQLLQALSAHPTVLLLTPGPARAATPLTAAGLRVQALPWLTQQAYDELLWACDLNFVRGEDSLVRALWAGRPWVWQAYRQHDNAHHAKVQALMNRAQTGAEVEDFWRWWNAMPGPVAADSVPVLPPLEPWGEATEHWRRELEQQASLAEQLMAFVHTKTGRPTAPPVRI